MQTIFLATDTNGGTYGFPEKPNAAKDGAWCGRGWFTVPARYAPPPGECREYRLVPVDEDDAKDARIAELEAKLADRSPGVMPEVVEYLVKLAEGSRIGDDRAAAYRVREYYATTFVFTGEPGRYRTDAGKCCDVFQHTKKLLGVIDDRDCVWVNSDGTFAGGRIVGRADQ